MKKGGLSTDQTLSITGDLRGRIDGLINTLLRDQQTHQWYLDRLAKEVYHDIRWRRLPRWAQSEIHAYSCGKTDMVQRYLTVFAYKYKGQLYRTHLDCSGSTFPLWDTLRAELMKTTGKGFSAEICEEWGAYWPSGKNYSAMTPEAHAAFHAQVKADVEASKAQKAAKKETAK